MNAVTGDVIATASLLLAVVAVLFSLWYAEIEKAIGVAEPEHKGAKRARRNEIKPALYKALPLSVVATAIAAVFLPRAVDIAYASAGLFSKGWGAWRYDDLKMAFLLTEGILVLLACYCVRRAWRLCEKWYRLRPPSE